MQTVKENSIRMFLLRPAVRWALYLVGWAVFGWALWQLFLISDLYSETPMYVRRAVYRISLAFYLFGFFVPVIFALSHRFSFEKKAWYWSILVHAIAAILLAALHVYLMDLFIDRPRRIPSFFPGAPGVPPRGQLRGQQPDASLIVFLAVLRNLNAAFFGYWIVLGFANGVKYYKKYQERALHATRLETQLASAQLQALKDQLRPHFLFNALHTLSSLIYEDVRAADKMIRQLSDLLRLALDNSGRQFVPLREEIAFLNLYLEIMKTRFQDRLQAEIEIEPDALDLQVPNLILQPLVENAIKHGFEQDGGGGVVKVSAKKREGKVLEIAVIDSGPGLKIPESEAFAKGVGLKNTVERLAQIYGSKRLLTLENQASKGLKVKLRIPIETNL